MVSARASKKQQELLQFIRNFLDENDYSPSYREIMSALGYKSVSTVAVHVNNLVAKGYLERREGSARSLELANSLDLNSNNPRGLSAKPSDLASALKAEMEEAAKDSDKRRGMEAMLDGYELLCGSARTSELRDIWKNTLRDQTDEVA